MVVLLMINKFFLNPHVFYVFYWRSNHFQPRDSHGLQGGLMQKRPWQKFLFLVNYKT
jgi:hypothetical protein